ARTQPGPPTPSPPPAGWRSGRAPLRGRAAPPAGPPARSAPSRRQAPGTRARRAGRRPPGARRAGAAGRDARRRRPPSFCPGHPDGRVAALGPPTLRRVLPHPAVDRLAEQVGVAGVAPVLLEQVEQEAPQRDLPA